MADFNLDEIEVFFNEELDEVNNKHKMIRTKRKWREIERFKETKNLQRELLTYGPYGY